MLLKKIHFAYLILVCVISEFCDYLVACVITCMVLLSLYSFIKILLFCVVRILDVIYFVVYVVQIYFLI